MPGSNTCSENTGPDTIRVPAAEVVTVLPFLGCRPSSRTFGVSWSHRKHLGASYSRTFDDELQLVSPGSVVVSQVPCWLAWFSSWPVAGVDAAGPAENNRIRNQAGPRKESNSEDRASMEGCFIGDR
jgi:hypothetical protein